MTSHAVLWAEGMFLRPHHFQASERWHSDQLARMANWHLPYAYGLKSLVIDMEALKTFRLVVRDLQIRFPSGTFVEIPGDCSLSPIKLEKSNFNGNSRVKILIGIPIVNSGRSNLGSLVDGARYSKQVIETVDEFDPLNSQDIDYRQPNVKLFLESEDTAGFETLPIARLQVGEQMEAPLEIDKTFIPPLLSCEASRTLQEEIIDAVHSGLKRSMETLALQMVDRGVAFESGHREDHERILKLQVVNGAVAVFQHLSYLRGLHPLLAYLELSRVCGELAIFKSTRQIPEIPPYDHDDLATCFYKLRDFCLEESTPTRTYQKRDFVGAGLQMQVKLEPEWVGKEWTFFVGVNSELTLDQCVALFGQNGTLNLKIASTDEVEEIFTAGKAGIKFEVEPQQPRILPLKKWVYFRVRRDTKAWLHAQETLTLAIRMNAKYFIEKSITDRREVRIRLADGQELPLAFSLYAIPNSSAQ